MTARGRGFERIETGWIQSSISLSERPDKAADQHREFVRERHLCVKAPAPEEISRLGHFEHHCNALENLLPNAKQFSSATAASTAARGTTS